MPLKKVHFKAGSCEFPEFTDGLSRTAMAKNISTRIRLDRIHRMPKPPSWGEIAVTTIIAASIVCPLVNSLPMATGSSPQSTLLPQRNVTNQTQSLLKRADFMTPWERHIPYDQEAWGQAVDWVKKGAEKVGEFILDNPEILLIRRGGRRSPRLRFKPPVKKSPNDSPKPNVFRQVSNSKKQPQGSKPKQNSPAKTPKQEAQVAMPNDKPCRVLGKVALAAAVAKGSEEVSRTIVSQTAKVQESLNETAHSVKRTIRKQGEKLRQEIEELGSTMEERLDSGVELVTNKTQEALGNLEVRLTETVDRVVNETHETVNGIRSDLNETLSDVHQRIEETVETVQQIVTAAGILRLGAVAIPTLVSVVAIIQNCCASRREKRMLETLEKIQGEMKRLKPETSPV